MNLKPLVNGIVLFIGLGLATYSQLDKNQIEPVIAERNENQSYEKWQLKPGSIYDGDTLRVVRGSEELKIRLCGIDAPEKKQELGVEARDHLRSLVDKGDGTIYVTPVEKDRYGRTVAELYVPLGNRQALFLNSQMVADGYAWHYEKYSANCPNQKGLIIALDVAKQHKLGIWNGNPQPPWDWRKANK